LVMKGMDKYIIRLLFNHELLVEIAFGIRK
jgi:hypothetical protein